MERKDHKSYPMMAMDPELFIRPDGLPMAFVMSEQSKDHDNIKDIVEKRGGILIHPKDKTSLKDHTIHLLGLQEIPSRGLEMIDYRFVIDCANQDMTTWRRGQCLHDSRCDVLDRFLFMLVQVPNVEQRFVWLSAYNE